MEWLYTTWYGILIICLLALMVLLILSTLLYRQFFKRFYDILLSFIAIIVLSPLLLILIVVGAIVMKGNPFFTQLRPGKNEKIFKLIKFRTMTNAKDKEGNLLPDEKRLVKYGKFLRSTSLDELPELFNILIGSMTIIGPRPQLVRDMVFMTPEQRNRHNVKPGLSGLAQCNGRNEMSWEKKFEYDLKYIEHIGLWFDIRIIFKTIFKVFKREGITDGEMATAMDLGDYLLENSFISRETYEIKQAEAEKILNEVK